MPAIPRTLSGKKLEVPVKRILLGEDPETAASKDALADPRALEPFEALAAARRRQSAGAQSAGAQSAGAQSAGAQSTSAAAAVQQSRNEE